MKGFVSPILYCSFLHIATLIPGSYYNRLYAQRLPFHNFNIQDGLIQAHVRRLAPKLAYSFEVIAPFQKTNWFLCGILGCCLLSGILIQYIISERNLRQIRQVDKRYAEEQSRSRILAAKDFQEEISDKLTSINMLTRQLKSKIIITPDNTSIINQIEQQTTGLYNSTSELLWLLDPANENLYHVLHHIRDLANDLLKDAPRAFTLTGDENKWPQYYLPSDRGRDLILIFKEAIDNTN